MPLGCKQVDYISFIIRRTMRQYNTGSMPSVKSDYRWKLLKVNCVCGTSRHENAWHESKRIEIPVQWILYVHNIQRDFWSTALLSVHNGWQQYKFWIDAVSRFSGALRLLFLMGTLSDRSGFIQVISLENWFNIMLNRPVQGYFQFGRPSRLCLSSVA